MNTFFQPLPRPTVTLCPPLWLWDIAKLLAELRSSGHDHCRKTHEDIGDNKKADFFGVAAELAVIHGLDTAGLSPEHAVLITLTAPTGAADFVLHGKSYDVKSVPPGKHFLGVNERQRLDARHKVDFVLPVVFRSETVVCVYAPIPYVAVASWKLRKAHSEYSSVSIGSLQPIRSLREVLPC